MKKIICLILISFFCGIVFADNKVRLFHIEISKNANIFCYYAILDSDGQINKKRVFCSYWIPLAEKNKKREDLNDFDKKNSFTTIYNKKDNSFVLIKLEKIKNIEDIKDIEDIKEGTILRIDKKITILMVDKKPKAKMLINNVEAYLEKIYIQLKDNLAENPSVSFYTLYGLTVNGNEPIQEKIIVK